MLKKLNWQAYTSKDRNEITEKIKDLISHNDGCIVNFTLFSDLALTLSVEIEEQHILTFHKALSEVLSVDALDDTIINPASNREWIIFLNISFSFGTGKMKRIVPAVPG